MRQSLRIIFFSFCILIFASSKAFVQTQNLSSSPNLLNLPISYSNLPKSSTALTALVTPDMQAAIDRISTNSLQGHLSFIASDLLEGRDTPSTGLEIAAEYIAAQFRRSGLETITPNGYFQTADWIWAEPLTGEALTIRHQDKSVSTNSYDVSIFSYFDRDIKINNAEIVVLSDENIAKSTIPDNLENKVVLIPANSRLTFNLIVKISQSKALLCIRAIKRTPQEQANFKASRGAKPGRLIHEEEKQEAKSTTPSIFIDDTKVLEILDSLKTSNSTATISINFPAPKEKKLKLKNVVGLLRGSDPVLKDTYVILSAHYDHLGVSEASTGDSIFNGANDNASGTVSLIEIADTLAKLKERPKRSILFMTFFGEEKGLYGSNYYVEHPLVPLEKTVANINLEQLGRTDSNDGLKKDSLSMTGFDFTDLNTYFKAAGEITGIKTYKDEQYSDLFFGASDNVEFAKAGIPSSTVCVAYTFPNYHKVEDNPDKIDYENMAKVDKNIALALIMAANSPTTPKWNEGSSPRIAEYVEAWKKLQAK